MPRRPIRGRDYQVIPPPSESLRMWSMAITGIVFLLIAVILVITESFNFTGNERPFEQITTLLVVGVTFLWFGTERGAQKASEIDFRPTSGQGVPPRRNKEADDGDEG